MPVSTFFVLLLSVIAAAAVTILIAVKLTLPLAAVGLLAVLAALALHLRKPHP